MKFITRLDGLGDGETAKGDHREEQSQGVHVGGLVRDIVIESCKDVRRKV